MQHLRPVLAFSSQFLRFILELNNKEEIMKYRFSSLLLGAPVSLVALPAYANNKNVEDAIHDRGDLGHFLPGADGQRHFK